MDKLKELLSKCKCGVYVEVNSHRDYYQTVEQFINEHIMYNNPSYIRNIPKDVLKKMIDTDTIASVQCYPLTPISFFMVFHYDIEQAMTTVLNDIDFLND